MLAGILMYLRFLQLRNAWLPMEVQVSGMIIASQARFSNASSSIVVSEELSKLSDAMKQSGHASLVYGKRRVGKTRLIKEALIRQNQSVIYYEFGSLSD